MDLKKNILRALAAEGRPEAMVNAVTVAGPEVSYDQVFAVVMEMENNNHIKLVYCKHPSVINVQATLVGHAALNATV